MSPHRHSGLPANDNHATLDVTRLSLQVFGPAVYALAIIGALWLTVTWP